LNDASDAAAIVSLLAPGGAKPLTKLVLSDNNLGDDTAKLIAAQLETNTTLTYLSLHKNQLGEEGGKALAHALATGCSALSTLFLTLNPLSDGSREELKKANASRTSPLTGLNGLVLDSGS